MKGLIQRVCHASVTSEGDELGRIDQGLLLLVGIEKQDTLDNVTQMTKKVAGYRVFADAEGRMNSSVVDVQGSLLVVSQFTLAAATRKGRRPSFSSAAPPAQAEPLYLALIERLRSTGLTVQTGRFGADMQVSLCNDGPVTFLLEC